MKLLMLATLVYCLPVWIYAQTTGSFTDTRDGRKYKTVTIGDQVWMAENLNYQVKGICKCYDNDSINCTKYGRLYDYESAMQAAPPGWHIPTDAEWITLEKYLGMTDSAANSGGYRGKDVHAGGKLKAEKGWKAPNEKATNSKGFNALPGGNYGPTEKQFYFLMENAMFWTATPKNNDLAYYRDLDYGDGMIFRGARSKNLAFSVRCVKN